MRAAFLGMALSLGFAFTSVEANAQVIVIGGGLAEDCYWAAEYRADLTRGFNTCTRALQIGRLSLRDRAASYTNRAVIRIRAGDFDGALADSDRSISLITSMGESHINRGAALLELDRAQEALTSIEIGLDIGITRSYLAYYNRGAAKEKLGDISGAYYDYRASADLRPDFALATDQLSRFRVIQQPTEIEIYDDGSFSSRPSDSDDQVALIAPPPWETEADEAE